MAKDLLKARWPVEVMAAQIFSRVLSGKPACIPPDMNLAPNSFKTVGKICNAILSVAYLLEVRL